ncbi:MAG: hypothetical protein HY320_10180 [Armatimonadetes bacterium]|nr:hypothetical protein [Armatimonadota bacterium]
MAATIPEFGQAVASALDWLGYSPDTAGPVVGIKGATLGAMCQGIVPMRSIVIRFAEELARQANGRGDLPDWWCDVDAWLALAGLPPRRELIPRRPSSSGNGLARPTPSSPTREAPTGEQSAAAYYQPRYERLPVGASYVHVFWLHDGNDQRVFRFNLPAHVDYRERAARLKQALASLTKSEFDRKYARYRIQPGTE